MVRLILVTFAFLAWAFWEMSGGSEFDPKRAKAEARISDPLIATAASDEIAGATSDELEVTRVSLDLTSVDDVVAEQNGSRVSSRLPQQSSLESDLDEGIADDVEIIPSLIENAQPEGSLVGREGRGSEIASVALTSGGHIRVVDGNRVNVRGGPGTNYGIVDTLDRGERVEVLDDTGTGWVRMRATGTGTTGWMADFLLTDG